MNTSNNRRRKPSREKIEKVFVTLLQTKEIDQIRVSEICQLAQVNRTTFYANYPDIYGLADAIRDRLETELAKKHFQNRFISYHMEFFKSGLTRIIKLWLENGCQETPEEMFEIIKTEYQGREGFFAASGT